MEILNEKKAILENDVRNMATRKNPHSTLGIYLTT